jgi:hypothetical protein
LATPVGVVVEDRPRTSGLCSVSNPSTGAPGAAAGQGESLCVGWEGGGQGVDGG